MEIDFCIEKVNKDFPIFLIKNFCTLDIDLRKKISSIILECKKRNHHGRGGSFLVDRDYNGFLQSAYNNFEYITKKIFGEYSKLNHNPIHSYCSNKYDHGDIPGRIHNHINTSTINSVYYLNIPSSVTHEKGSISFFMNEKIFTYKPNNDDLLIFPNHLDHRINNYDDDEEWRISINMEIICSETSNELFNQIKI